MVRASQGDAEAWVNDLFGPRKPDNPTVRFRPKASRLRVSECVIENSQQLRQARIRIDRFTGGVVDGALFDEEPDFRGKIHLHLELRNPRAGEPGLLLLLLKDLLTRDLALGGTSSVGRGVVTGTAEIRIQRGQPPYRLDPSGEANTQTVRELNQLVSNFATAEKRSETS
jgi:CRISPR/Cas system CSM-associated protein Csm3 (group 7 of RAMP superfamily)